MSTQKITQKVTFKQAPKIISTEGTGGAEGKAGFHTKLFIPNGFKFILTATSYWYSDDGTSTLTVKKIDLGESKVETIYSLPSYSLVEVTTEEKVLPFPQEIPSYLTNTFIELVDKTTRKVVDIAEAQIAVIN